MKISLSGEFEVSASPEEAFAFISTPNRFAPVLPYFKDLKNAAEGSFVVVLEIGVPQIRGIVEVNTLLIEQRPPEHLVYKARGHHTLGMMDSMLMFDVAPTAEWLDREVADRKCGQRHARFACKRHSATAGKASDQIAGRLGAGIAGWYGSIGVANPNSSGSLLRGLFGSATGDGTKSA